MLLSDSRYTLTSVAVAATLLLCGQAHAERCFDIAKGEPRTLSGELSYVLFPGPPNYEDIQKGDTPEQTYVLRLDHAICILGDEFADPSKAFDKVHLVGTADTWPSLKANVGNRVVVTLKDQMGAATGHHHEPLVAWVTDVSLAAKTMSFVEEYGSPATTIRAFYAALGDGQGGVASMMVVPEKRTAGPFAATSLTRFYGGLRQPIRLLRIDQNGPNTFTAHYRYTATKSVCEGQGLVTTVTRAGKNYIESIKALKGC
jgi:hypothetical protein